MKGSRISSLASNKYALFVIINIAGLYLPELRGYGQSEDKNRPFFSSFLEKILCIFLAKVSIYKRLRSNKVFVKVLFKNLYLCGSYNSLRRSLKKIVAGGPLLFGTALPNIKNQQNLVNI